MKKLKMPDRHSLLFISVISSLIILLVVIGYKLIWQNGNILVFKSSAGNSALEEKMDSYMNLLVELKTFSGTVLVAKKGEILVSKGYGMANYELGVPNTPKTRFTIASMSKTFTAAAVLRLEEQGRLSLQDTLEKYIPDYPNGDKIKIENLLTFTSGIPDYLDTPELFDIAKDYRNPQQLVELFKNKPLEFEPGSKTKYSNSDYALLGYIIEKVTGDTLEQYLKGNIFIPLDMKDTGLADNRKVISNRASGYSVINMELENCDYSDISFHLGAGGIYSTCEDLYKWERALTTEKILTKQSIKKMFTPGKDIFGYGWVFLDPEMGDMKKKLIKTGGLIFGFEGTMDRYIEDDVVIIILCNFENFRDGGRLGEISQRLAAMVYGLK